MNEYSIVSQEEMSKLKASGVKEVHLKAAAKRLSIEDGVAFCKLNVMFYIDDVGDFFSKNTPTAKIVRAIYNSLGKEDQQACMMYLMDSGEDE